MAKIIICARFVRKMVKLAKNDLELVQLIEVSTGMQEHFTAMEKLESS